MSLSDKQFPIRRAPSSFANRWTSDAAWAGSEQLTDFSFPWESGSPPSLTFRALYDDRWLYCMFDVKDTDVRTYQSQNQKEEVIWGDRVEIFFRQNEKLAPYYCLEVDPHGRVYDYRAEFYRKFEPAWNWPFGQLRVSTQLQPDGYTVKLAIALDSLRTLGLLTESGRMEAGLFRGKCLDPRPGDPAMRWISWVRPNTREPDFHVPSAFGVLQLSEV